MNGVLPRAKMARLASPLSGLKRAYPTPRGQNVYVSCPRCIRFTLETYTFSPRDVYVLLAKRIRFVPIRLYVVVKAERRRTVEEGKD